MEPLRVGLCGLGTVGRGVVELLARNADRIAHQAGRGIEVVRVASRTPRPAVDLGKAVFTTQIMDVVDDPSVDVVVETMGDVAASRRLFEGAVAARKHFVTANKALIATAGGELLPQAARAGVAVGFEAAVAGGIPIVKTLREGLAGNNVQWIAGIINGTSNFILTAMASEGRSFADALADAQARGYAEADPAFDVQGIDAAHKLTILAALAFDTPLDARVVYAEGVDRLTPEDIEYAHALGYRVKHLGIARRTSDGVELRVHPTLIPEERLLAKVDGVMNAVVVNSDAVGSSLYYGPGAGAQPTASAIVSDLIDLARGNAVEAPAPRGDVCCLPMSAVETAYYLRIPSVDQPGVLAKVAQILSVNAISIEAVIQREHAVRQDAGRAWVPVIILTHRVKEAAMDAAVSAIEALDEVIDRVTRIRVEPLDDHA